MQRVFRTSQLRRLASAVSLGAATLCVAVAAQAQTSIAADSSPFRPKQLGVEFGIGGNFGSIGLLRFATPQRAWLFNVEGSIRTNSNEMSGTPQGQTFAPSADQDASQISARLGVRRYRPVTEQVQRFITLGVLAAASRSDQSEGRLPTTDSRTFGGGAFAEIGAAWMVTPNLSLGAVWNADVTYSSATTTREAGPSVLEITGSQLAASFGRLSIRGNIFF